MCLAVRDRLRQSMGWDRTVCAVRQPPGDVPAAAGELFVAVFDMGEQSKAFDSLDLYVSVGVCLTRRTAYAPDDRVSEDVVDSLVVGLEVLADQVRAMVHADFPQSAGASDAANNYAVLDAANNYIVEANPVGATVYGFTEPLRYLSRSTVQKRNGDWFQGDPSERDVGVSLTLNFGSARKIALQWEQG